MQNINVNWQLPATRESGKPLNPADIAAVEIELSADGGANYAKFDEYPPAVQATVIRDLEPGTWFVRGLVRDTAGRKSAPVSQSIVLPDTTPPSVLPSLTLAL